MDFIKTAAAEGKEKHVPTIEVGKDCQNAEQDIVRVIVGKETPHPNTAEHFIAWVELFGRRKDNGQVVHIGRAAWAPVISNPNVRFQVNNLADYNELQALSYCNIHGLWGNTLSLG